MSNNGKHKNKKELTDAQLLERIKREGNPLEKKDMSDNFLFAKVMRNNKGLCKKALEEILNVKIRKIEYITMEKVIEISSTSKGIRMDIYLEDNNETIYNLEIQTSNKKNLAKRMRYYQSAIDADNLQKGVDYKHLNKSYIIFICTYDECEDGKCYHMFETLCRDNLDLKFKDAIVLTTVGDLEDVSQELRGFLKFIENSTTETLKEYPSQLANMASSALEKIKESNEMQVAYLKYNDTINEAKEEGIEIGLVKGREEGIEEGRKKEKRIITKNLLLNGYNTIEEIAQITGLSIQEIEEIRKEMKKLPKQ